MQNVSSCRRTRPIEAQRWSVRFGLKMPSRPREFHPEPLTGRVEDWRAGLGRSLYSLFLALSFASVTLSRPCHVSSPRHVERSVRISRTALFRAGRTQHRSQPRKAHRRPSYGRRWAARRNFRVAALWAGQTREMKAAPPRKRRSRKMDHQARKTKSY